MRSNYIDILKQKVEIPIIQRDYAQGRTDNKTNKIRKDFLDVLFEFIQLKDKDPKAEIELDFIYGFNEEDGFLDKAFYKKENETSGIIIKHGKTNEEFRIGFGKNFSFWTDFECNWVDYWGLVEDRETSETTFTEDGEVLGSKQVILQKDRKSVV